MVKLNRRKFCQCGCGKVVHNKWVMGHQFRGVSPHNKGTAKPIELYLCECGCGEMVPGRFKRGHGSRVNHWSKGSEAERIKSDLSFSASQRTGEKSPRYGKTKETNPAFSNAGRKKGCITWNKGGGEYLDPEARERVKDGSRECRSEASNKRVKTNCANCGKEMVVYFYRFNNASGKVYCGSKCYGESQKRRTSYNCDYCGTLYERCNCFFKYAEHHFCSKSCSDSWRSENMTGSNNNNWKPKVEVECAFCKKTFEVYPCHANQYNFCDRTCESQWRSSFYSGEGNPNWRGGVLDNYEGSFPERLKLRIKTRDGFQCRVCGKGEGDIHVHHIDYNKKNSSDMNLISLCNSCHSKVNFDRVGWQGKLTKIMESSDLWLSQASYWIPKIDPSIIGSGYIRERSVNLLT